jgi:flagellar basal-body rod protein FlgB
MYESMDIFRTAGAMARHAGARAAVVAENIANADTPGYRARAIGPFAESYQADAGLALRATRPGHIQPQPAANDPEAAFTDDEPSPNGNSVSLETEMLNGVEVAREHSRALAIYKHALGILRTSLGR